MDEPKTEAQAADLAMLISKIYSDEAYSFLLIGTLAPMVTRAEAQALYSFSVRLTRMVAPAGEQRQ